MFVSRAEMMQVVSPRQDADPKTPLEVMVAFFLRQEHSNDSYSSDLGTIRFDFSGETYALA